MGSERVAQHGASEFGTVPISGMAARYAAALYAEASEQNDLDEVAAQMRTLGQLIAQSDDVRRLLASPLVDVNESSRAILAVLDDAGVGRLVRNLVGVVAANRRLAALPRVVDAFAALIAEKRGIVTARVASAHPLTEVQEQQLRARLIEAGYGNVEIIREVDPSLLGGLVVKIGARLYDTSLKSRLQRLQNAMKGAA